MSRFKDALLAAIGVLLLSNALLLIQHGTAQARSSDDSLSAQVAALKAQMAALQAKTASFSVSGTDRIITGVNVHIVSGSGATDDKDSSRGLETRLSTTMPSGNLTRSMRCMTQARRLSV